MKNPKPNKKELHNMEYIEIGARRDAYSVEDIIKRTLTVGELIEILEGFDESSPVVLSHDGGYTYGALHESRITAEETDVELDEDCEEEEIKADDLFDESWDDDKEATELKEYIVDHDNSLPEDEDNELFVYQWYWGWPDKDYQWFLDNTTEEERKRAYEYFKKEGMSFYDKFTWFSTGKRYGEGLDEECLHCEEDDEDDDLECDDDFGDHENSYDVDEAYSFKGLNDNFGGKTLAESLRPRAFKRKRK